MSSEPLMSNRSPDVFILSTRWSNICMSFSSMRHWWVWRHLHLLAASFHCSKLNRKGCNSAQNCSIETPAVLTVVIKKKVSPTDVLLQLRGLRLHVVILGWVRRPAHRQKTRPCIEVTQYYVGVIILDQFPGVMMLPRGAASYPAAKMPLTRSLQSPCSATQHERWSHAFLWLEHIAEDCSTHCSGAVWLVASSSWGGSVWRLHVLFLSPSCSSCTQAAQPHRQGRGGQHSSLARMSEASLEAAVRSPGRSSSRSRSNTTAAAPLYSLRVRHWLMIAAGWHGISCAQSCPNNSGAARLPELAREMPPRHHGNKPRFKTVTFQTVHTLNHRLYIKSSEHTSNRFVFKVYTLKSYSLVFRIVTYNERNVRKPSLNILLKNCVHDTLDSGRTIMVSTCQC